MPLRRKPQKRAPSLIRQQKYVGFGKEDADDSDVRYFAPEPVEEKKVDKDVTEFLLKDASEASGEEEEKEEKEKEKPRKKAVIKEHEWSRGEGKDGARHWYLIATIAIIFLVGALFLQKMVSLPDEEKISEKLSKKTEETSQQPPTRLTIPEEKKKKTNETFPLSSLPLPLEKGFVLNLTRLKPIRNFRELDSKKSDLIEACNDSEVCRRVLSSFTSIGIQTESKSYTIMMNREGKIVDLKNGVESADLLITSQENDLVALYNALAINDEETVILKMQKVLPLPLLAKVMQETR